MGAPPSDMDACKSVIVIWYFSGRRLNSNLLPYFFQRRWKKMKRLFVFLIGICIVVLLSSCGSYYQLDPYSYRECRYTRSHQPQLRIHTRDYSLGTGRSSYFRYHGHGRHRNSFSVYNLDALLNSLIFGASGREPGRTRINIR